MSETPKDSIVVSATMGSPQAIKKSKPILAICIYHKA
jgi:hypothetical protein